MNMVFEHYRNVLGKSSEDRKMAIAHEKLARSLMALKTLQDRNMTALRTADLSRTDRERLVDAGYLQPVMRGWCISSRPGDLPGDTTAWYASYWNFCRDYLTKRFDRNWCLSPQQSLKLHAGDWSTPEQLLVRAEGASNKVVPCSMDQHFMTSLPNCRCQKTGLS